MIEQTKEWLARRLSAELANYALEYVAFDDANVEMLLEMAEDGGVLADIPSSTREGLLAIVEARINAVKDGHVFWNDEYMSSALKCYSILSGE